MTPPDFIVFEGPNYSGKSTALTELAAVLLAQGREVVTCREPGGTPFGEALRVTLKDPATRAGTFASALAFNAARKELNEVVIGPALARGAMVLLDRYFMSTEIFQGTLAPDVSQVERTILASLHRTFIQPDLTVFLLPSAEVIQQRIRRARLDFGPDRFEGNAGEVTAYEKYAANYAGQHPTLILRPKLADEGRSLCPQVLAVLPLNLAVVPAGCAR